MNSQVESQLSKNLAISLGKTTHKYQNSILLNYRRYTIHTEKPTYTLQFLSCTGKYYTRH